MPLPPRILGEFESLRDLVACLRRGETSCVSLVRWLQERYAEWEPKVHAWVVVDWDAAAARATELDQRWKSGAEPGPLHGIPVGIKDIIDVKGWPTKAGSSLWDDQVAERDARVVELLKAAGAIVIGKTVTTQHASFDPPSTRNPWNLEHTPGGSSSGSAAATATGMCQLAIGSQTGGSIIRPASYCGVAGFKPTFGTVSVDRVRPLSPSLDHVGPIARTVDDLALSMSVIADSAERRDAFASLWMDDAAADKPPLRLGLCLDLFEDLVHPELLKAVEDRAAQWQKQGVRFEEWSFPASFSAEVLKRHRIVMAVEAALVHRKNFAERPDDYLPNIRALIEEGAGANESDYLHALAWKVQMAAALVEQLKASGLDGILLPATTGPAPGTDTTGDPAFNSPFSMLGFPEASFPIRTSQDGLPLAAQIVGAPGDDVRVLRSARRLEILLTAADF